MTTTTLPFRGKQRTFTYTQSNTASADRVFPLLCPVRECDWLDGWTYRMIHSRSGLIEKNCVFTTPHHGSAETVWHVTQYQPELFQIEFLRVTPGEHVVRINIMLVPVDTDATLTTISYQYTALSEAQNRFIEEELEKSFRSSMMWWEKAINHYLNTGTKLKRSPL
jgi:hypothetical protein